MYCDKVVGNFSVQHMFKDTHFLNRTIIFSFCSFQTTTFLRDHSPLRRIYWVEFCGEMISYGCLDNNYNRFKYIKSRTTLTLLY